MRQTLYAVLFIVGLVMPRGFTIGEEAPLSVEIDAKDVICEDFIGFGAEWDSRWYPDAGVTEEDFDIIRKRVEWMRLPVARIMMQCRWCYKGNGKYDWYSREMKALYRHLDVCQSLGTTVFLADWGCEPEWLRCPDVVKVDDPKYSEIIGTYMTHLLREKGYTCIKYFIMVNEPNYEVKDWDRWKEGLKNVHAQFQKRGLADKVILTGSDHSNADVWHRNAVDQLQDIIGCYDIHKYASDRDVRPGKLFDYFKESWDYARQHDPETGSKPFVVGEAGLHDDAQHPHGNRNIDKVDYGVFMADYAVQAANAGSASVMAWMLDDNSHPGFFWGLWTNKEKGLKLRPWFYSWSILSRYFPPGSHIVRSKLTSTDVRVLAGCAVGQKPSEKQSWTFCIVNRADEPRTIRMRLKEGCRIGMNRYIYSKNSNKTDENGFPAATDHKVYDFGEGADITCEASSVVILSSMQL